MLLHKQNRQNTHNSESTDHKLNIRFVTEQQESQTEQKQNIRYRIECLQAELKIAKDKEAKLRVTNTQLSNMILSSNQNAPHRAEQYIQKIEEAIYDKLKIGYKGSLIDQKISQLTKDAENTHYLQRKSQKSNSKPHSRNLSDFSTLSSFASQEYHEKKNPDQSNTLGRRLSTHDIRAHMARIKRIQKQVLLLQ